MFSAAHQLLRHRVDLLGRRPTEERYDLVVESGGFVRLDRTPWLDEASEGSEPSSSPWTSADDSDSEGGDWAGSWTLCIDAPGDSSEDASLALPDVQAVTSSEVPESSDDTASSDDVEESSRSRRLMAATMGEPLPLAEMSVSVTATT